MKICFVWRNICLWTGSGRGEIRTSTGRNLLEIELSQCHTVSEWVIWYRSSIIFFTESVGHPVCKMWKTASVSFILVLLNVYCALILIFVSIAQLRLQIKTDVYPVLDALICLHLHILSYMGCMQLASACDTTTQTAALWLFNDMHTLNILESTSEVTVQRTVEILTS